jgi:uncharacterized OsmC-like protein
MDAGRTEIRAEHLSGDAFELVIRDHLVTVDQPSAAGGDDLGPTPTELFVASLAGCVGFYAERYLRRHGLPDDGLSVRGSFAMSDHRPARVTSVELEVRVPAGIPQERLVALSRVIEHCTVHNSIRLAPEIRTRLVEAPLAAVA